MLGPRQLAQNSHETQTATNTLASAPTSQSMPSEETTLETSTPGTSRGPVLGILGGGVIGTGVSCILEEVPGVITGLDLMAGGAVVGMAAGCLIGTIYQLKSDSNKYKREIASLRQENQMFRRSGQALITEFANLRERTANLEEENRTLLNLYNQRDQQLLERDQQLLERDQQLLPLLQWWQNNQNALPPVPQGAPIHPLRDRSSRNSSPVRTAEAGADGLTNARRQTLT